MSGFKLFNSEIRSNELKTKQDLDRMILTWKTYTPEIGGFDTESSGLHILCDSPFLFQFGWWYEPTDRIYTFLVDIEADPAFAAEVMEQWFRLAGDLKYNLGQNIKYDLHMSANVNQTWQDHNLMDTQILIRMAHDNIPADKGGAPLGLKDYIVRYIDKDAKLHEHKIRKEQSLIAKEYNLELQNALKESGALPPDGYKSWTQGCLNELFKDKTFEPTDLDVYGITDVYNRWYYSLPERLRLNVVGKVHPDDVPYSMVDRDIVKAYGHLDIVYLIYVYRHTYETAMKRNEEGIRREQELIMPLYRMERVGFQADREYLITAKAKMRDYIRARRLIMCTLANEEIGVGQHKRIAQILGDIVGYPVSVSNDGMLMNLKRTHPDNRRLRGFIEVVQELRTLEKWYSVYLKKMEMGLKMSDRLYTQINQVGAASGRVSSDFQQFPKKGIKDHEGNELFHPRRLVVVSPGYKGIVYEDYSQIELRVQALYTILCGEPDLNLCRAYMPYKCVSKTGTPFDYNNKIHIATWYADWFHEEDGTQWHPLDLHGATTKIAFDCDESHPRYKEFRSTGKMVNFAKNYGARRDKIGEMFPDYSEEQITKIDGAYYKAFPGIKTYQAYCYNLANLQAYATNLFGVKYWHVSGHNLINMLIQGSSAYLLKQKIVEVDRFLYGSGYRSRFQMNIHDELSFEWHPDDPASIFLDIKKILETWEGAMVPIVADLELTTTCWAEKEDWDGC